MKKSLLKSVGAVFAGLLLLIILSVGTDAVLQAIGLFPDYKQQEVYGFYTGWKVSLAITYRTLFTILGGWLTAVLAPARPLMHAFILALVCLALNIFGAVTVSGKSPLYYGLSLIILCVPAAYFGGWLIARRKTFKLPGIKS